jgi:hypothetical protein
MEALGAEISGTMARNAQRNKATLNVMLREKEAEKKLPPRPSNPFQCKSLQLAVQYRHQVARELSHLISTIGKETLVVPTALRQDVDGAVPAGDDGDDVRDVDAAATEAVERARAVYTQRCGAIRKLNEDINALLRSLKGWDKRVVALGGESTRQQPSEEHTVAGITYFGAARNLPEYVAAQNRREAQAVRRAGQKRDRETAAKGPAASGRVRTEGDALGLVDENALELQAAYFDEDNESSGDEDSATVQGPPAAVAAGAGSDEYAALIRGNTGSGAVEETSTAFGGGAAQPPALFCIGCCRCQPISTASTPRYTSAEDVLLAQITGLLPVCYRFDQNAKKGLVHSTKCAAAAAGSARCAPPEVRVKWNDDLIKMESDLAAARTRAAARRAAAQGGPAPPQASQDDEAFVFDVPEVTQATLEADALAKRRAALKARIAAGKGSAPP